eukprot:COSAG01_NODE_26615_length_708_cov_1.004926_1_plen_170_part_10
MVHNFELYAQVSPWFLIFATNVQPPPARVASHQLRPCTPVVVALKQLEDLSDASWTKVEYSFATSVGPLGSVYMAKRRISSCTTVSTYLFAFQGGSGADRFRYLPYICDDDVTQIGDKTQRNKGGIAVGEYMRPGATLNPAQFKKNEYHLYELVYDPRNAKSANKKDHGI